MGNFRFLRPLRIAFWEFLHDHTEQFHHWIYRTKLFPYYHPASAIPANCNQSAEELARLVFGAISSDGTLPSRIAAPSNIAIDTQVVGVDVWQSTGSGYIKIGSVEVDKERMN